MDRLEEWKAPLDDGLQRHKTYRLLDFRLHVPWDDNVDISFHMKLPASGSRR